MLTNAELRQAVFALDIIEQRGDSDVFQLLLKDARDVTPCGDDWKNLTVGEHLQIGHVADELSKLLGEDFHRCENAARDVLSPGRQQLIFATIVRYAIELIDPCIELTGQSPFVPYADRQEKPAPTPSARRPSTIRIVREDVA